MLRCKVFFYTYLQKILDYQSKMCYSVVLIGVYYVGSYFRSIKGKCNQFAFLVNHIFFNGIART